MGKANVKEKRTGLSGAPMVIAVLAVLTWVVFVIIMLLASDAGEKTWTRLTFVFASVEAIAFAAAGALFGVSVQRERVEKAETRADVNERDAANGRALAAVNLADAAASPGPDPAGQSFGTGTPPVSDLGQRHAELARHLFPDV